MHAQECVCAMGREDVCFCVPPGEPPRPDGVSDGTLITQPSKKAVLRRSDWRGDGCVVVGRLPLGKNRAGLEGGSTWNCLRAPQVSNHGAIPGFPTVFPPSLHHGVI